MKKQKHITARDYAKIVEWSDEDHCFIGSAPPLVGQCCHGDTQEKVLRELCQIVDEYIEMAAKDGDKLPDPRTYSGKFLLRIDPALHRLLATRAEREGDSLNNFVAARLKAVV